MKEDNSPQKDEGNNKDKINDLLLYNISKEKFSTPSDCIAFPIKDFALGFLCSANLSSGFRLVTPI